MLLNDEVLLGRLAVQNGRITQEELGLALQAQVERGGKPPLGELLIELGLLSRVQLDNLVAMQKANLQAPSPTSPTKTIGEDLLGRRAIEAGLISREQLDEALRLQGLSQRSGAPKRLGEILTGLGILTFDQVWMLLAEQGKRLFRCEACKAQFNVQGAPPSAALRCRRCGAQLSEVASTASAPQSAPPAPPQQSPVDLDAAETMLETTPPVATPPSPRTPTTKRPTSATKRLHADGTWYGKSSDLGVPLPEGPAKKTATRITRITKAVKVAEGVEYLPYERRTAISPRRNHWTAVGGVGLLVLVALLLVRLSGNSSTRPHARQVAEESESEPTSAPVKKADAHLDAGPAPGSTESPEEAKRDIDQLKSFLSSHADDPVACVKRIHELEDRYALTPVEGDIRDAVAGFEAPLRQLGAKAYDDQTSRARALVAEGKYGEALKALPDLPKEKDPLCVWNPELERERQKTAEAARAEWKSMAANARALQRAGRTEEAILLVARARSFGVADVEKEAEQLQKELVASLAQAPEVAPGAGGGPAAPAPAATEPPSVSLEKALSTIAGGVYPNFPEDPKDHLLPCPLCGGMVLPSRTCPACDGKGHLLCLGCGGKGKIPCPGYLHGAPPGVSDSVGSASYRLPKNAGNQFDWIKKCKICKDAGEIECPLCHGAELEECAACGGRGSLYWHCPLSGMHGGLLIPRPGTRCWPCGGKPPFDCPFCEGSGKTKGALCNVCYNTRHIPCPCCRGLGAFCCPQCFGRGYFANFLLVQTASGLALDDDKRTCPKCHGKAVIFCQSCNGSGLVACTGCAGKDPNEQLCWNCQGKGKIAECPRCRAGGFWWTRTKGGAFVFMADLADLMAPADLGFRNFLGGDKVGGTPITWMVLFVDNRHGTRRIGWTGKPGALTIRGNASLPGVDEEMLWKDETTKRAFEREGHLFGIFPEEIRGGAVATGESAMFLLPCLAASAPLTTDVLLAPAQGPGFPLFRAPLDSTLRTFLLWHYWKRRAPSKAIVGDASEDEPEHEAPTPQAAAPPSKGAVDAQGLRWLTDFEAAKKEAKDSDRPILLCLADAGNVQETWEKQVFADAGVKAMAAKFVLARVEKAKVTDPSFQAVLQVTFSKETEHLPGCWFFSSAGAFKSSIGGDIPASSFVKDMQEALDRTRDK